MKLFLSNKCFLFFRVRERRTLDCTIKSHLNRDQNCVEDVDYSPDDEIMQMIVGKINCSLPWSPIKGMKTCDTEDEFEQYLNLIFDHQADFSAIRKKCKFKNWKAVPYSEKIGGTGFTLKAKRMIHLILTKTQVSRQST